MDPERFWTPPPPKALLYSHDLSAKVGHISQLMHEHMPQLGALQVDRDPEDAIFSFLKRPGEFYEAGKLWKSKLYNDPTIQSIAHNSLWVPANTGKLPAVDFIPRMQALIPNLLPDVRDNILASLLANPAQYATILTCSPLNNLPSFRPHFGNGIIVLLHSEDDFQQFTSGDCILNNHCARRPIPFVSKKEIVVPRLLNAKGCCPTCGASHRLNDCAIHKQYLLCKSAIVQRAMVSYYKLSKHIYNYLDPIPPEVCLPEAMEPTENKSDVSPPPSDQDQDKIPASKATSSQESKKHKSEKNAQASKPKIQTTINFSAASFPANKDSSSSYIFLWPQARVFKGGGINTTSTNPRKRKSSHVSATKNTSIPFRHTFEHGRQVSIPVIPTKADGNCFFNALTLPESTAFSLIPSRSPLELRKFCYHWALQHPDMIDILSRKTGFTYAELLEPLHHNFAWIGYGNILIVALALGINLVVISTFPGGNMFSKPLLTSYNIPFEPPTSTAVLFHPYGSTKKSSSATNHFSLLQLTPVDENEFFQDAVAPRAGIPRIDLTLSTSKKKNTSPSFSPPNKKPPDPPDLFNAKPSKKLVRRPNNAKCTPPLVNNLWDGPLAPIPHISRSQFKGNAPPAQTIQEVSIFCWNATSLRGLGRLETLADASSGFDVLCIQESNLSSAPILPGFNIEMATDHPRPRGSICLIRENLVYHRRKDVEALLFPLETVVMEFIAPQSSWMLVNCYFNPHSSLSNHAFVQGLKALHSIEKVIICGDFNSPGRTMGNSAEVSARGKILDDYFNEENSFTLLSNFDVTFIRGSDVRSALDGVISSTSLTTRSYTLQLPEIETGHVPYAIYVAEQISLFAPEMEMVIAHTRQFIDWNKFFALLPQPDFRILICR
jgi:hypothetical protein